VTFQLQNPEGSRDRLKVLDDKGPIMGGDSVWGKSKKGAIYIEKHRKKTQYLLASHERWGGGGGGGGVVGVWGGGGGGGGGWGGVLVGGGVGVWEEGVGWGGGGMGLWGGGEGGGVGRGRGGGGGGGGLCVGCWGGWGWVLVGGGLILQSPLLLKKYLKSGPNASTIAPPFFTPTTIKLLLLPLRELKKTTPPTPPAPRCFKGNGGSPSLRSLYLDVLLEKGGKTGVGNIHILSFAYLLREGPQKDEEEWRV